MMKKKNNWSYYKSLPAKGSEKVGIPPHSTSHRVCHHTPNLNPPSDKLSYA